MTVHLDLDGARHIYRLHGWRYERADDPLFDTGLRRALELFAAAGVTATLFVIAEDIEDPRKRPLLEEAVRRGHEIASHSITHARLAGLPREIKRCEIVESRDRLAQRLGVRVDGFRAPDFSIDRECLELIDEAGYAYDSSLIADAVHPAVGPGRTPGGVHRPLAGSELLELPLPAYRPLPFPYHPSYSLVLGSWYFRAGTRRGLRTASPFVLLFHLTDFADPLPDARGWAQRLFTLSHRDGDTKRMLCRRMLEHVGGRRPIVPTSQLIAALRRVPEADSA